MLSTLILVLEIAINRTCISFGRDSKRVPKGQRPKNRANHNRCSMVESRLTYRSCRMPLENDRGSGVPVGLPGGTFIGSGRGGEEFPGTVTKIKTSAGDLPGNNSLTLLDLLGQGLLELKIGAEVSCSSISQSCRILSCPGTMTGPRGLLGLLTADHFDL